MRWDCRIKLVHKWVDHYNRYGYIYRHLYALRHLGWVCCGVPSNNAIIQIIYGTGSSGHPRETDGTTPPVGTGYIDAVMMMPTAWNIEKQALEVTSKYGLDERVSINDAYGMATVSLSSMLPLVTGIAVIFIAGYLLIYNVFYISIAQDIRFYGMLKTLGTTARQIRKIVYKKAIKLSLMGIPIGLLLGWPIGRLLLPAIVNMLTDDIWSLLR